VFATGFLTGGKWSDTWGAKVVIWTGGENSFDGEEESRGWGDSRCAVNWITPGAEKNSSSSGEEVTKQHSDPEMHGRLERKRNPQ